MNMQTTVPAVLLHYAGGDLLRYPTRTDALALDSVRQAANNLAAYKPALVHEDDVDAVLAALEAEGATT